MPHVTLSESEALIAEVVGCLRRNTSIFAGMKDKAGRTNDFTADAEGAAGEMAVCKALNIYWPASNKTFSLPDAADVEIKLSKKLGELAVNPKTPDDRVTILVEGEIPNFYVAGWIRAGDAKRLYPKSNKNKGYPDAHFVPWEELLNFPITPPVLALEDFSESD